MDFVLARWREVMNLKNLFVKNDKVVAVVTHQVDGRQIPVAVTPVCATVDFAQHHVEEQARKGVKVHELLSSATHSPHIKKAVTKYISEAHSRDDLPEPSPDAVAYENGIEDHSGAFYAYEWGIPHGLVASTYVSAPKSLRGWKAEPSSTSSH
jgi:hypothetical protein